MERTKNGVYTHHYSSQNYEIDKKIINEGTESQTNHN